MLLYVRDTYIRRYTPVYMHSSIVACRITFYELQCKQCKHLFKRKNVPFYDNPSKSSHNNYNEKLVLAVMPRERQKRGRRAEAKQRSEKRKRDDETEDSVAKRQKSSNVDTNEAWSGGDYISSHQIADGSNEYGDQFYENTPFYGFLDPQEQAYFSHANELLDLDNWGSEEEKALFTERVFEEADGKELKVACSQGCSRIMEKLISSASPKQLKQIFKKFQGNFLYLSQHRFASHCCECLFTYLAPVVSQEMKQKTKKEHNDDEEQPEDRAEDLFLGVPTEFEGNWGYLLTERFASHTIRVLLLVFAGEPLETQTTVVASRKKENVDITKSVTDTNAKSGKRAIPPSFNDTLQKMMNDLVFGIDNTYLRALATHPVGNPVMQVLLQLELTHLGKSRAKDPNSIVRRLIPDESLDAGSQTIPFLRGLLYDPVGSRLLETVVRYTPGKMFKGFFKNFFRENLGTFARNEIASYVVVQVLERLSKEDLESSMEAILPQVSSLVERSRLIVIKSLIERGAVRGASLKPLADALEAAYGNSPDSRLKKILRLTDEESPAKEQKARERYPERIHGSLLAQAMLKMPGNLCEMIQSALLAVNTDTLMTIAKDSAASHVLQQALTQSSGTLKFRRRLAPRFFGHMKNLALDSVGSHVIDSLWFATQDIIFVKERFAAELAAHEPVLRDSFLGRAVWKNWAMDLYGQHKGHWVSVAKGAEKRSGDHSVDKALGGRPKSQIDLARDRFAANANNNQKIIQRRIAT